MIDLRLGDCLEHMRELRGGSIDCVFADPPFNARKEYLDDFDDEKPLAEYRAWLGVRIEQMARVLKEGGYLWLMQSQRHIGFCQNEIERLGLNFHNIVAWAYTNPTPAKSGLPQTWRPILLASKGKPRGLNRTADCMSKETLYHNPARAKSHYPDDLWSDIPKLVGGFLAPKELILTQDKRFAHLAQMPERIAARIILLSTNEGESILDPFAGSGTVGVMAKRLGRNFSGMEISEQYFKIAKKRIVEAQLQSALPLTLEPIEKAR